MRKDIAEIRRLKQEGHDIIDRIVRLHTPRSEVYRRLAAKMQVGEPYAHFQNIFTVRECKKAIAALEQIEHERKTAILESRARRRREQVATYQAAKLLTKMELATPWWKKLWIKLTT